MKMIRHILPAAAAAAVSLSCQDMLDVKVDNDFGDELTWSLPDKALGVLNTGYANLPQHPCNFNNNNFSDALTDNALTIDWNSSIQKYVSGGVSAGDDPMDVWSSWYNVVRNINLFIENGLGDNIVYDLFDKEIDWQFRQRTRGEAHFMRAWFGVELLRVYGGIADDGQALGYCILTQALTNEDNEEAGTRPRDSFEECVLQILADCDVAIACLPFEYAGGNRAIGIDEYGRVTRRAAHALKSRAALLGASPAYQPEREYAVSPDSVRKKWLRAAQIAQQAIDEGEMFIKTALTNAMLVGTGVQDNTPEEVLFRRWTNNTAMEANHFPPLFFGAGKTNPSQNLVNAYPMLDGFPITDPRSGYDPEDPYTGRDLRLGSTVYFNGEVFNGQRALQIYADGPQGAGRDAEGYDYRNTLTGYYLRKGLSAKSNMLHDPSSPGTTQSDFHINPLLRVAEVYYNLAEASNMAVGPAEIVSGCSHSAYDIIREYRSLYGITSTIYLDEQRDAGREAFHTLIMNERRLEFAFENMRLWDIRRHRLPLDKPILGVKITRTETGYEYVGTRPGSDDVVIQERPLADERYFSSPIPYAEIVKNPGIKQNRGW